MINFNRFSKAALLATAGLFLPSMSSACGGFFCTTVPINQAAEQILFSQQGDHVSAMVSIVYSGNAEDFSWVVPVPDTPEISLGANATFAELDFATRPQFFLRQEGDVCEIDQFVLPPQNAAGETDGGAEASTEGVTVEEQLTVGPFDIDIVSSDNADDMSIWLQDNNYLLTDRGRDLIEPYVLAGMKFVALKLKSGESSGSIQPLIMKYPSDTPMVPIRLTAVAAEDDMGVIVWVVNNARAIPENYEHVTPNYTKLDWYSGSFNAYASYQTLVTDAMNEAGGRGFATDYAGPLDDAIHSSLTNAERVENNLVQLDAIANDAQFISNSLFLTIDPAGALSSLPPILPLPEGFDTNLYFDSDRMESVFTPDELRQARIDVRASIVTRELEPIRNALELLPRDAYITRMYTTLSADEMTVDPTFNYNANMPEQPRQREALLSASCDNNVSQWNLTLGEGTGREGQTVLEVTGQPIPGPTLPQPINDQPAAFLRERTSAMADPELLFQADTAVVQIGASSGVVAASGMDSSDDSFLGASGVYWLLLGGLAVWFRACYRRV